MIGTILKTMRVPFLILTPACIFLGLATAFPYLDNFPTVNFILILSCGLLAHISVNMFNEYHDFHSGLDAKTTRTPFSGGSGGLLEAPQVHRAVLFLAVSALLLTAAIGFYFMLTIGIEALLFGIVIILTYTKWLNRSPLLCLLAPGISFGTLMVLGAHWVLAGNLAMTALLASIVPLCLVSNLLLLNQLPDIQADMAVGRRHFPIQYGIKNSVLLYILLVLVAITTVTFSVAGHYFPVWSLISLLPLFSSFVIVRGVWLYVHQKSSGIESLIPFLGLNVAVTISTPVILGLTLIFGH